MAASPNDTVVLAGSGGVIVDAAGNRWTISPGLQVLVNERPAAYSANVEEIAEVSGVIWHENTSGQWYSWNGAQWIGGENPMPSIGSQVLTVVQQILATLPTLATKQELQAMSDAVQTEEASILAAINAVGANVSAISADAATISAEIATLKTAQPPDTLTPAAQTALDNILAAATSLQTNAASTQGVVDNIANPAPPNVPTPPPA